MRSGISGIAALLVVIVVLVVGYGSVFTVTQTEQALLIRLYRLAGEDDAAEEQFASFARVLERSSG